MDIFTLSKEDYDNGTSVKEIQSAIWVEKYNNEGEFSIVGPPSHQFMTMMAEGTLISHTESESIMMVESHTIDESEEGDTTVTYTGRTIDQIAMENRVVTISAHETDAFDDDFSRYLMEFNLSTGDSWDHVNILLDRYLNNPDYNPDEAIPNLQIRNVITGDESPQQQRVIDKLGILSSVVRDILASVDAGLKIERKNWIHPDWIEFVIHKGEDKKDSVRFDWNFGDLESARYVWSIKDSKNSAYISTDFYTVRAFAAGKTGLDLRIMPIDANDWKKDDPTPDSTTIAEIKRILRARAADQIGKRKALHLVDTKNSKTSTRFRYNLDYKMGDLVSVGGNYGANAIMRVVEHAIASDKNGTTRFPTLAPVT